MSLGFMAGTVLGNSLAYYSAGRTRFHWSLPCSAESRESSSAPRGSSGAMTILPGAINDYYKRR
ncbi:hypothetical protein [Paenibacillus sophorae]|uniref:Uncharacterized protein n=1 Tax=Paenibacillus sophorae TaxID=1333845 RepID=A0ABX8HK34_9BACL|nr:hypothetical protein [Paenibacillus sophorae]QWU18027.1 hypothetical protein KP014_13370 [Paenibacillus sophorae]